MSIPVLIRLAPVLTLDKLQEQAPSAARRDLFSAGALVSLASDGVPVVVDHDESRVVGRVREFYSEDDSGGGRWIWARCDLDAPPGWLKVGGGASFSHRNLHTRDMLGGWRRIYRAAVGEVSLLSPSRQAVEPRARVAWIGEECSSSSPGRGASSSRRPGEVFYGDGKRIRRYFSTPIAVRDGRDVIVNQPDGSQIIYGGPDGYAEALRDGVVGVR